LKQKITKKITLLRGSGNSIAKLKKKTETENYEKDHNFKGFRQFYCKI